MKIWKKAMSVYNIVYYTFRCIRRAKHVEYFELISIRICEVKIKQLLYVNLRLRNPLQKGKPIPLQMEFSTRLSVIIPCDCYH